MRYLIRIYAFFFRLDPALIRPGRVDMREYIGHCSAYQLEQMFARFYPHEPESRRSEFANLVMKDGRPVSPALVQGFFMFYKDSAQDMIDNVTRLFEI